MVTWLETHEALAGWAQFFGAVLALAVTYFTAFAPAWRRKRQLKDEATRLLMHGYEVIERFHVNSARFAPFQLSLRQASLSMAAVMEDLGRFPVYELDNNFGSMSLARRLMAMRMAVATVRLFLDETANDIGDRPCTDEETSNLRQLIEGPLEVAKDLLLNRPMVRPEWPDEDATSSIFNGRSVQDA